MRKHFYGRGLLLLFWMGGFLAGTGMGSLGTEDGRVYAAEVPENAENESKLAVVFWDDKGRKVCVSRDGVLQLSEKFRLEIPLDSWEEGQEGVVEVKVTYGDGREEKNDVRIKRGGDKAGMK